MDENDERVFMVRGEDMLGDQHVFMTTDEGRATKAYQDFLERFVMVKTNGGFFWVAQDRAERPN